MSVILPLQAPLETVGAVARFWFLPYSLLLYIKIERIDWFLYALTLYDMLYCMTFFSFVIVRQSLLYSTEARTCLFLSLRVLVKFRLTVFLNARQRSIPGGIRVGKVTDGINVNGSVCAPQNAH